MIWAMNRTMIRAATLFALMALSALPARANETVVAGLSQNRISITANFDGSELLIYGAVKRESPAPAEPPLQVIVTVQGPSAAQIVRRKDRRMGIWVNTDSVRIDRAPSFYTIATTAPLSEILSETENLRHHVSIPRAIRAVGIAAEAEDAPSFTEALIRIRERSNLYTLAEGSVDLVESTLFRTDMSLPANLTEGAYRVRIFLTRDGQIVDVNESVIEVHKEGLERWLHSLAHEQPLLYGLMSLLLAIGAGWLASTAFSLVRL
jgi:uncharacterized protein (TIGR02186 family)